MSRVSHTGFSGSPFVPKKSSDISTDGENPSAPVTRITAIVKVPFRTDMPDVGTKDGYGDDRLCVVVGDVDVLGIVVA